MACDCGDRDYRSPDRSGQQSIRALLRLPGSSHDRGSGASGPSRSESQRCRANYSDGASRREPIRVAFQETSCGAV